MAKGFFKNNYYSRKLNSFQRNTAVFTGPLGQSGFYIWDRASLSSHSISQVSLLWCYRLRESMQFSIFYWFSINSAMLALLCAGTNLCIYLVLRFHFIALSFIECIYKGRCRCWCRQCNVWFIQVYRFFLNQDVDSYKRKSWLFFGGILILFSQDRESRGFCVWCMCLQTEICPGLVHCTIKCLYKTLRGIVLWDAWWF